MRISGVIVTLVVACFFAAFAAGPARATVINGSFEASPDFSGWLTIGETSIETAAFGSGPTDGSKQALLTTAGPIEEGDPPGSAVPALDLELFLGLAPGTLTGISPSGQTVFEGSAIKTTFSVSPGDTLSFDVNFLSDEADDFINDDGLVPLNGNGAPVIDFSFFTLAASGFLLLDVTDLDTVSPTIFIDETGFETFSVVFLAGGPVTLGFGVVDTDDEVVLSGLLVDDVRVTSAVPEPAAFVLVGLGLVGLAVIGARRLKRGQSTVA